MHKNSKTFNLRNPWRQGKSFLVPKNYITRNIEKKIKQYFKNNDILIIYGSRQVGKTTLLYKIMQDLHKTGVSKKDIFYFSADDINSKKFLRDPADLIEFLVQNKKHKIYLFIDEAQKIENPGIFLKNLYDYKIPGLKIIVTGSSTLEIKSKIIEYLPGRKQAFLLHPLSLKEIKQDYWKEYLIFGGYPKVFLSKSESRKKRELKDIYESYIKKDISGYLKIEKPEKFNQLAILLSDQISGLINIDELTNTLNINRATVEKYISMMEDTFVIKKVYPFFMNKRTEISKMPKIYFLDLGIRNIIFNNFNNIDARADSGKLAENFVFNQLEYQKSIDQAIHFWRTKSGAEIDFVVQKCRQTDLYEVKYKKPIKNIKTSAIRSFGQKYGFNKAYVLSNNKITKKINKIHFTPLWKIKN